MDNPLEVIPPVTLDRQVLDKLRTAILEGRFQPEVQLNQVQIAAMLGVSRGPVRAALSKLEEEGLVRNIPHRGTFVTPLEKEQIRQLYEVRAVLESFGMRLAVEKSTPADVAWLAATTEAMRQAAVQGDSDEVIRLDLSIHEYFMQLAGNTVLYQTWAGLHVQVQRVLTFRHRSYPNLLEIADSHLLFIGLMEIHSSEEAARLMAAHIHEACSDLMDRWHTLENRKEASA
jgi:DNA-binding GntR family transcriptional regulator